MEKDLFYHSSDESPAIKWLDPTNFDRYKRQSNGEEPDSETGLYRVRTCSLYVQSDQKLYEHIFTHEGQRSEKRLVLIVLLRHLCNLVCCVGCLGS